MDRDSVDPDRRNICSRGLHVAAWDYAQGFSGSRLLLIKVNPKDVVAVPPDYNEQKMRVCEYLVLKEWTEGEEYAQSIYEEAMVDDSPSSEVHSEPEEVEEDFWEDTEELDDEYYYYGDEEDDYGMGW